MGNHASQKKCLLLVIGSWLVAKLWWTLEMSRLAFFRTSPKKTITYVAHAAKLPPASHWTLEQNRLSVLTYDEQIATFIITILPELNGN
ncbi:MAG: olfactory receptor subfamily 1A-like [candidate division KSB1 bacterium]|nr:olfactory receptor subfamily 1A-like [candidate division KSB1 bacterium]MDZ7340483.1 olfactory receptor subfamily 1A-like [candidate division KSB1 bacterium]